MFTTHLRYLKLLFIFTLYLHLICYTFFIFTPTVLYVTFHLHIYFTFHFLLYLYSIYTFLFSSFSLYTGSPLHLHFLCGTLSYYLRSYLYFFQHHTPLFYLLYIWYSHFILSLYITLPFLLPCTVFLFTFPLHFTLSFTLPPNITLLFLHKRTLLYNFRLYTFSICYSFLYLRYIFTPFYSLLYFLNICSTPPLYITLPFYIYTAFYTLYHSIFIYLMSRSSLHINCLLSVL